MIRVISARLPPERRSRSTRFTPHATIAPTAPMSHADNIWPSARNLRGTSCLIFSIAPALPLGSASMTSRVCSMAAVTQGIDTNTQASAPMAEKPITPALKKPGVAPLHVEAKRDNRRNQTYGQQAQRDRPALKKAGEQEQERQEAEDDHISL